MTNAVRHFVECRLRRIDRTSISKGIESVLESTKSPLKDPVESIIRLTSFMSPLQDNEMDETIETLIGSSIKNPETVLQDLDIQRLRAIIYRDVVRQNRSKNGKSVVAVVVNFSNFFSVFFLLYVFCLAFFINVLLMFSNQIVYVLSSRIIQNNHNFYR